MTILACISVSTFTESGSTVANPNACSPAIEVLIMTIESLRITVHAIEPFIAGTETCEFIAITAIVLTVARIVLNGASCDDLLANFAKVAEVADTLLCSEITVAINTATLDLFAIELH